VGGTTNIALRDNRITASATVELRRSGPAIVIEKGEGVEPVTLGAPYAKQGW
jgi:hypothetical protein